MSGFHITMEDTASAIDARQRTGQHWHDMAAGGTAEKENRPNLLRVQEKDVILQAVGRGHGMKNQWIIKT